MYVPDATRNKLEDRATKQIFVGYGDRFGKKGYRLYNPITCKFQFSRSCIFYEISILSPSPQDTSHEPSNQNSKNLTHEEYDPSNDTMDLISHISNTNNKQPTPYLSTQEQSHSLQTPQEPTPLLTSENPKTPKPPSKPIPTHKTSSSSIHRYKTTSTKPKFTQRTSARLKAKTYTSLPPHPTLFKLHIQVNLHKTHCPQIYVSLTPQFHPSMPPLNDNASYKIQNGVAALKGPEADHWWAAMEPQIESINEKGFSTLPKGFSSHHKKMAP